MFGKVFSAAYGPTSAEILDIKGSMFGGGIRAVVNVRPEYRERNFAIFVNGIYVQSAYCPASGGDSSFTFVLPIGIGSTINSFYMEDIGTVSSPDEDLIEYIAANARYQDSLSANRILMKWTSNLYKCSPPTGTTQLSAIVVTGAKRGVNCETLRDFSSRAKLNVSINSPDGFSKYIRLWNGPNLVSEAYSTVTNGDISGGEINGSGISFTATMAYTGAINREDAFLELQWPKEFNLYWSTSAIDYANPNATYQDNGGEEYNYVTPELANGTYNWNVVPVDDEGDVESSPSTPAETLVVNNVPGSPTITAVTCTTNSATVTYTAGTGATSHKVYFSTVNGPINFGDLTSPTPVTSTSPASITIPAFTTADYTTNYNTIVTAFDSAVATCNTNFGASGATTFTNTNFATFYNSILTATDTFGDALGLGLREVKEDLEDAYNNAQEGLDSILAINTDYGATEWENQAGVYVGNFYKFLGGLLNDNPQRYALANGGILGSPYAGESTGATQDGTVIYDLGKTYRSLLDIALPLVRPNIVRIVVRAIKSGVEEQNNNVYLLELNDAGTKINPRPAPASVQGLEIELGGTNVISAGTRSVSADNVTGTSLSWSHTVAAGDRRILVVFIATSPGGVTSPTYAGQALTELDYISSSGATKHLFYLIDPPVGTANISCTIGGPTPYSFGSAICFYGIETTAPWGSESSYSASNTDTGQVFEPFDMESGDWLIGTGFFGAFSSPTCNVFGGTQIGLKNILDNTTFQYTSVDFYDSTFDANPVGYNLTAIVDYYDLMGYVLKVGPNSPYYINAIGAVADDNMEAASFLELYVVTDATDIDAEIEAGNYSAIEAVTTQQANYKVATFDPVGVTTGWYKIAVVGKTAAGVRSNQYEVIKRYVSSTAPTTIATKTAYVLRGQGT